MNKQHLKKVKSVFVRIELVLLIAVLSASLSHGQTDAAGNPVFNSVTTGEFPLGEKLMLIANYYTLANNIENIHSSVFIAESPSVDQVEDAAVSLMSDFFILTKKGKVLAMFNLTAGPDKQLAVVEMASGNQWFAPIAPDGDLTEYRADELLDMGVDPMARKDGDQLSFNGKSFRIITREALQDAVIALVKEKKLDRLKPSDMTLLSKAELAAFVLAETKPGGKLDFFTEIKGRENDGIQIKPGVFSTRLGIALYKWGRACFDVGVNTADDALDIFAKFKEREPNERERGYIKKGFHKELEK